MMSHRNYRKCDDAGMRRQRAPARSGQRERPDQSATPRQGAGWAAALSALVVVLSAAATIVDKRESLRWLWVVLIVAGVLVGVPAAVLATPWGQQWQATKRRRAAVAARRAEDQRDHFDPLGRGVSPAGRRWGWYFTGRTQALRKLADWLRIPPGSPPAVQVVTGAPGSGKSAVLGRLVLLADPTRIQAARRADPDLDDDTLPPLNSIDLSVHVRNRTLDEVVESIGAAVELEEKGSVEDLLDALRRRPKALTVVADALDEATDAEELAGALTRMAATGGVRLLVGTLPHLVDRLVDPSAVLDLDDPAYWDPADVAEYVRRCLLLEGDPEAPTPYRGQAELAATVADAVAARAGRSFLVAQLVSLTLVNDEQVVDITQPRWHERFPRQVKDAMRDYLDKFGEDRFKVRDLLMPLAFAEGDGLTDEGLWAALATELGTSEYKTQDVGWLLQDTSAPNLLQRIELEGGVVGWRLFHAALAEYLRDKLRHEAREVQRRITQVLYNRVPTRNGRREWLAADAYTRSHLATHADAAGRLDNLVGDPGMLLAAEPTRLLRVMPTVTSAAARAYQQAVHQLTSDRPLGQRASCLQRAARYCGATELAERIEGLGIALPWTTRWAHWRASGTSRQLTGHPSGVQAVALGEIDEQPVIVSGGSEGRVRRWDARSGHPRGEPLTGHTGSVNAVVLGQIDGQPMIISGGDDCTVWVWDEQTGQAREGPLTGHTGNVNAVALGQVDGQPVIVSGSRDGTVRRWDARSGQPRGEPLTGHDFGVQAVALGQVDRRPVILSSGWSTVCVWDLRSGQHFRIEADAEAHGVVCTPKGLIVAATSLGLAAFQLSTTAGTASPPSPNEVRS
jgi:uncharacterized protein (DUF779 family)